MWVCVLSGRDFCDRPITHPGESYRLCMCHCDLETSEMRRSWPALGCYNNDDDDDDDNDDEEEGEETVRLAINLPWEHRICTTQPCTRVQWALGNCDGRCRDARAPVGNKRVSLINSIHRPSWRFSDYRGSGDFWHSFATLESLPERLTSNWNVIFYSPGWCTEGKIKYGGMAPAELTFLSAEKVTSMKCKVTTTEEQRHFMSRHTLLDNWRES